MGFSSFLCKGCGHPMLSEHSCDETNEWMTQVVVIKPDGNLLQGTYNGYCHVISDGKTQWVQWTEEENPTCYHEACWKALGKPTDKNPSADADDQGYFFDEGTHDMKEPKSRKDLPL